MLGLERVTAFDWGDGNSRKSLDKHGVGQSEAEQVFFNTPLLLLEDASHSHSEPRFHALGKTDSERWLHITFTLRGQGTKIRVISARNMSRRERTRYDEET